MMVLLDFMGYSWDKLWVFNRTFCGIWWGCLGINEQKCGWENIWYRYGKPILYWLVVWNMAFIFAYIGTDNPNWFSYFSEGLKPPTAWLFGCFLVSLMDKKLQRGPPVVLVGNQGGLPQIIMIHHNFHLFENGLPCTHTSIDLSSCCLWKLPELGGCIPNFSVKPIWGFSKWGLWNCWFPHSRWLSDVWMFRGSLDSKKLYCKAYQLYIYMCIYIIICVSNSATDIVSLNLTIHIDLTIDPP